MAVALAHLTKPSARASLPAPPNRESEAGFREAPAPQGVWQHHVVSLAQRMMTTWTRKKGEQR